MGERREAAIERMDEKREAAVEKMGERRDAAVERMGEAREVAVEAAGNAKAAAAESVATAKAAAAEQIAKVKPKLRGVSHEYAFFVSLVLGVALIVIANGGEARLAAGDLRRQRLGPVRDQRPLSPPRLEEPRHPPLDAPPRPHDDLLPDRRHRDPVRAAADERPVRDGAAVAVWAGALAGTVIELLWTESPKWASSIVYVVVGLIGAIGFPAIAIEAGWVAGLLIAAGGLLYMGGAVVYAIEQPGPEPGGLRLPRDLPRAGDRRGRGALRRRRLLRPSSRLASRGGAAAAGGHRVLAPAAP